MMSNYITVLMFIMNWTCLVSKVLPGFYNIVQKILPLTFCLIHFTYILKTAHSQNRMGIQFYHNKRLSGLQCIQSYCR